MIYIYMLYISIYIICIYIYDTCIYIYNGIIVIGLQAAGSLPGTNLDTFLHRTLLCKLPFGK